MNILRTTTKGLINWKPEAEGERQQMSKLYTDLLGIKDAVDNNQFIIMGRKGAGKSAYAVQLQSLASQPNSMLACESIDSHSIQIEKLINEVDDGTAQFTALLEWLILSRLVNLILNTQDGKENRNYKELLYFHKNISGHIHFTKDTIKETLHTREFNISALDTLNLKAGRQVTNKNYKASFFSMIESLRYAVCDTLKMEVYQKYQFYILIDDLDVDFSLRNEQAKKRLLALLRIVCKYNNDYLLNTNSKILVFVRDDIATKLSSIGADSQKMLDSYGYTISWYRGYGEENYLYEMINHRLEIAFKEKGIPLEGKKPWEVFASDSYPQFKRLLDYTFYLPRDIINIIVRTRDKNFSLPMTDHEFALLIEEYAPRKYEEICNELAASFDEDEINDIKKVLRIIAKETQQYKGNLSYDQVMEIFESKSLSEEHFRALVEHNVLVPVDMYTKNMLFSYREKKVLGTYDEYLYALPKVLYEMFCNNN